ncbi:BQ2448_6156 [Microbotryum intermedium]|uniref:BQ2448_6156 protein n=1 Tax=Microbotryum intermedium TaxID=269621 RepID=A0A238FRJ6_9BASI|nr:BQ2448_6156 [Microbotryum intermedium]
MNIIVPAPEGLGSPDIDYYQSIHPSQPLSAFTFASPSDQCEYSAAPTLPSAPTGWPLTPQTPGFDTFERPTYDNYSPHMSSNHDHCVMASTSGLKLLSPMADVDSESNARHYCTSIMSSPVCGGIPPSPMVEQGMFDFSQNMHYDFHPLDSYSSHALAAGGQSMGLDCVAEPSLRKWVSPQITLVLELGYFCLAMRALN